jgi:hypothetical protein
MEVIGKFEGEFAASAQTYAGSGTLRYSVVIAFLTGCCRSRQNKRATLSRALGL